LSLRVDIQPVSGEVPPMTTTTVTVKVKAGKTPQRVRGLIQALLFDTTGSGMCSTTSSYGKLMSVILLVSLPSQCLTLRCEVQSVKVCLYPLHIDVGMTTHSQ
jgi:hypothetical protein